MKKILHLIETSEPGGAETMLAYTAANLDRDRYESLVGLLERDWLDKKLSEDGTPYVVFQNKYAYDPFLVLRLVKLIWSKKISLIHAHEFAMNVYGAIAGVITGTPMIGTVHGKQYYPGNSRRTFFYRMAVSLSKYMITVSDDLNRFFVSEVRPLNARKVRTIHNGIDLAKYRIDLPHAELKSDLGISREAVVAITTGSLFEVKGLSYLMQALASLAEKYPDFVLLIVGEGDQKGPLLKLCSELNIGDKAIFTGFRDDIPQLLSMADFYVCSSLSEGLSLSIAEAMAVGKSVVATDVGGNSELVHDQLNGYLVPAADPEALSAKMSALIDNKDQRLTMGHESRKIAEANFSLKQMIMKYEAIYRELIR